MIEIFNQEKRMENFSRMKRFINSEESRFNQTYRRNIITGLNKLFYSYGDDEERAEEKPCIQTDGKSISASTFH